MKPSGSACIVTDLRRKWLLAFPEYGGFGNRPGFGLNTNKASIKLTFFFADLLDAVSKPQGGMKGDVEEQVLCYSIPS